MAQSKETTASKRSRRSNGSKSTSNRSRSSATKARRSNNSKSKTKTKSTSQRSSGGNSTNATEKLSAVGHSVGDTAKSAGRTVGKAASKAKVPLIASGAALAGVASGAALASRQVARHRRIGSTLQRRPMIKVTSRDVARAAKEVGHFSAQMGELAGQIQRARDEANGRRRRSPIEVVLQGLTTRR